MATDSPYLAARGAAALLDLTDRGRLLVTGADSASYLQGLLTNDIEALTVSYTQLTLPTKREV